MNYGHPLAFGLSIDAGDVSPATAVALARHADALGLNLVVVQEQTDQPDSLDAWTLASWIAGQTDRIKIIASARSGPSHPPAVVARAAASLDLLSHGRLGLILGAEGRSPAEYAAIGEAIEIIRAMLAGGDGTPLTVTGEHYRIARVQGGPTPAHDIPIWVSGDTFDSLDVLAEKADGWLTSTDGASLYGFSEANRMIDAAALETGRDPREIRRVVTIAERFEMPSGGVHSRSAERLIADLVPMVVEDGAGTLVLRTDDLETVDWFARDVVPALREAVDRALPDGFFTGRLRRADVRAKRRAGIAYDDLPASLVDSAVEPGDSGFARVKSTYMRGGSPGLVLPVTSTEEVVDALAFARRHPDLPLSVRSGGHGISGRSTNDGGIVIDLSRMNAIEVLDPLSRRVRIEPGARWMDVAAALDSYGWALSSGDYGGVGVGGLATAGGIGWLVRKHGLTIDHLRAATLVLADGSVVRVSDDENQELFWAVRGAGANFGIVTSFEFEVDKVGDVGWAQFVFDASDTAGFLERWGAAVEASPRELTSFLIMGPPRRGQPVLAQLMTVVASDQPETIIAQLQPLAAVAPLYDQRIVLTPYAGIMANAQGGDHNGRGDPVARTGFIEHITPEFASDAAELIRSGVVYFFQIRSVGGAVADVDPDATAYAHRNANFSVTAFGASRPRVDAAWDRLRLHFDGLYLSFETDLRPERLEDAFPPRTLERLRELKSRVDPDNLFRDNFNISPRVLVG